jgi:hypothetical protein
LNLPSPKNPLLKRRVSGKQKNNNSSNATSEEDYGDNQSAADDFACVPANNMDNDTVHIKILDDEHTK